MTYFDLTNYLLTVAKSLASVSSGYTIGYTQFGFEYELGVDTHLNITRWTYPAFFLIPTTSEFRENSGALYGFRILLIDQLLKDKSNRTQIYSKFVDWAVAYLQYLDQFLTLEYNFSLTPFDLNYDAELAGWSIDINIWTYYDCLLVQNPELPSDQPYGGYVGFGSSGTSGFNGSSGIGGNGSSGISGTSGINGINGSSGITGTSGTSGVGATGSSGTSGVGNSGTSGTSGKSGSSGITGTSGTSGKSGSSGISGIGINGSSGTSAGAGTSGVLVTDYPRYRYVAHISQTGTTAPYVVPELLNTTGTAVSYSYNSAGNYTLTCTGKLTIDKTDPVSETITLQDGSTISMTYQDVNTYLIETKNSSAVSANAILDNQHISFDVYW